MERGTRASPSRSGNESPQTAEHGCPRCTSPEGRRFDQQMLKYGARQALRSQWRRE